MPARPIRHTDTVRISNIDRECEVIAAGADPLFGDVTPDDWTAYSRIRFGKSLPLVAGPESVSGAVFGIHPAVLARSYQTIVHKQMNMGHQLVALGSKEDRICGCVLACAFPEEPEGGWVIPESVDDAPHITAFATLFKQAKGVDGMLGKHLAGKVKMSVSMEFTFYSDEVGIYDPHTRTAYDRKDIPKSLWTFLAEDEKGRLIVRKSNRSPKLVLALGGVSGNVWFSGVGYTDRPAESTAGVESFAASKRQGMMVCETLEAPSWAPGMKASWVGGDFGKGEVRAVYLEGTHRRHNKVVTASLVEPVLDIRLPNGMMILRRASSVSKKI